MQDILNDRKEKFENGRLVIPMETIWEMFRKATYETVDYIKRQFDNVEEILNGKRIESVVVVGGYANSRYVIEELRQALQIRNIPVVRPFDTEKAVLCGAVLFGQDEKVISSRIASHTYGVGFTMKFDGEKHDEKWKFTDDDGTDMANHVFRKHVTIGQPIELGKWIKGKKYEPENPSQQKTRVHMFATKLENPKHTDDDGCRCIGYFDVDFPSTGNRSITIYLNFGGAEIKAKAQDSANNVLAIKHMALP